MVRVVLWGFAALVLTGSVEVPARAQTVDDPLPDGAVARLGTVRFRQGSSISSLALTADGKTLASVGSNSEHLVAYLWDARSGRLLSSFKCLGHQLAFSPRGDLLAASDYKVLGLIDPATGKVVHKWQAHEHYVRTLRFSPDGKCLVSASMDESAALWEVPSGKLLHRFTKLGKDARTVGFSPDGKQLFLSGLKGIIRIHDCATFQELRRFPTATTSHEFQPAVLSPDGKILAVATTNSMVLWNVATGQALHREIPTDRKGLTAEERTLPLVRDGKGVVQIRGGVHGLAFSPDGKTLAAAGDYGDHDIRFIDVATNQVVRRATGSLGSWNLVFYPDGKTLASGGGGGIVQLWDVATGRELLPPYGHRAMVRSIAFAQDGKTLVSSGWRDGVYLWDVTAGKVLRRMDEGEPTPMALAFSPDGKSVAGATDEIDLRLWDADTGKLRARLRPPRVSTSTNWVSALAFSPDSRQLSVAAEPVRLWNSADGKHVRTWAKSRASAVAFAPDGKLLASAQDAISLWDPIGGEAKREFGSGTTYKFLQFVEGGTTLLSGDVRGNLTFWAMPRGKLLRQFKTGYEFEVVAVAPDGLTAVTAGGKHQVRDARGYLQPSRDPMTVRLWDLVLGKEIRRFDGHTAAIRAVAFAADGRRVASAGHDTSIVIWDATSPWPEGKPAPADVERLGLQLSGDDAVAAWKATWLLVRAGDTGVKYVQKRWARLKEAHEKVVRGLVDDLGDDDTKVRDAARRRLAALGLPAWTVLRRINETPLPSQVRDRLEEVMEQLRPAFVAQLRLQRRSVMILEQVGTKLARAALAELATLAVDSLVAIEARAALMRRSNQARGTVTRKQV